jgi:hypothetical protein
MSATYNRPRCRMGRPPACPPDVVLRIKTLKDQGYSLQKIVELFNGEGTPTPAGKSEWYKSMVERTTKTLYAREVIAQAGG